MLYDIHTKEDAQETLYRLTGIPFWLWYANAHRESEYLLQEDFVAAMIDEYGTGDFTDSYTEFDFVYLHVTTSADCCDSIRRNGILDLKKTYECTDSELRRFLDNHDIHIDLDNAVLSYQGHSSDITFGECPVDEESLEYKCWSIGEKFYHDFATCGFLSVLDREPYGGYVHKRPEILFNIDELLQTRLSEEWEMTHSPYEVVAKVNGENAICLFDDAISDSEIVMTYLVMAYNESMGRSSENIVIMKNGVQISPSDLLAINPLNFWK